MAKANHSTEVKGEESSKSFTGNHRNARRLPMVFPSRSANWYSI